MRATDRKLLKLFSAPKGRPPGGGHHGRCNALNESNQFLSGKTKKPSPWSASLRYEYEKDGLHQWDTKRVNMVAKLFHCTVKELCAIAGMFDAGAIGHHKKNNAWPMYLTVQWNKLLRFKFGDGLPDTQDRAVARQLNAWRDDVAA